MDMVNGSGLARSANEKSITFSGTYLEVSNGTSQLTLSRASHKKRNQDNWKVQRGFDLKAEFNDDILVLGWRAKLIKDFKKVIVSSANLTFTIEFPNHVEEGLLPALSHD